MRKGRTWVRPLFVKKKKYRNPLVPVFAFGGPIATLFKPIFTDKKLQATN